MNTRVHITQSREAFEVITRATDALVNLAKPTYGPSSGKIVIDKVTHKTVLDDGVQIARDLELPDPSENAILRVIREAATKTSARAGDGTTSALIMVQAILHEVARLGKFHGRKVELELRAGLEDFQRQILKDTKTVDTQEELEKVAMISFDNPEIAHLIAGLFKKLGKEATITLEKSPTLDTYAETAEGVAINTGYISPYMVNNPETMECKLSKPHILITNYRLMEGADLDPIMNLMAQAKKKNLVVLAENVEESALSMLVLNLPNVARPDPENPGRLMRGNFPNCAINIPKTEDSLRTQMLEDIALLTGATVFSREKGRDVTTATLEDLGTADRFIAGRESSLIIEPGGVKKDIAMAVTALRLNIKNEKSENKKAGYIDRLNLYTNSVATIKVGAPTEYEQKALMRKVENVKNSVGAAYKNGVVCGGGLGLARIKTSSSILNNALQKPQKQLLENMGIDKPIPLAKGEAYNAVTEQIGQFMAVGVMDPVDVLIAGVESAVSIASLLLTTEGIIAEAPEHLKQE